MEENKKCKLITHYNNAVVRKFHNKKVAVLDMEDGTYGIEIKNFDKENANTPCITHKVERGVVRVSSMRLSKETLEAIIINYLELIK
jgi:hypothetical protein